jgi:hypothetical protein
MSETAKNFAQRCHGLPREKFDFDERIILVKL